MCRTRSDCCAPDGCAPSPEPTAAPNRNVLPVRVTGHYAGLVEAERADLPGPGGPLYNVVYPKAGRFECFAPGEVVNYVEDFDHMPPGLERVVVHRYPHKLLYFPTDSCLGHCQYCFRPDVTSEAGRDRHRNLRPAVLDRVVRYLRDHPRVREVIFSGGDPLVCDVDRLAEAVRRIAAVPTVRFLRLHTRAPVYDPSRVTGEFVDLCVRHRVRVVCHVVHPYELSASGCRALRRLTEAGVRTYNQFPLLRGINDHPAVVMELAYRCDELSVQMLTMFVADPIQYSAVYRLRLGRAYDLADEVFRRGEGWISNFRVCLDTPIGKVRREHVLRHNPATDTYHFCRDGRTAVYRDIPADMDRPTPLKRLLYRGGRYVDLDEWPQASPTEGAAARAERPIDRR